MGEWQHFSFLLFWFSQMNGDLWYFLILDGTLKNEICWGYLWWFMVILMVIYHDFKKWCLHCLYFLRFFSEYSSRTWRRDGVVLETRNSGNHPQIDGVEWWHFVCSLVRYFLTDVMGITMVFFILHADSLNQKYGNLPWFLWWFKRIFQHDVLMGGSIGIF